MEKAYWLGLLAFTVLMAACGSPGVDSGVPGAEVTLTLEVEGEGETTPREGTRDYDRHDLVFLKAEPAEGWGFVRWEGPVNAPVSPDARTVMDTDVSLIAIFEEERTVDTAGERISFDSQGVDFHMRLAPAATVPTRQDGVHDLGDAAVVTDFWIAETQVTYELWHSIGEWAVDAGYTPGNLGLAGSETGGGDYPDFENIGEPPGADGQQPVTMVSFRDAIVWCNALSEKLGKTPVYRYNGEILRDAADEYACDNAEIIEGDGFRLPTNAERELAAKFRGSDSSYGAVFRDGLYWSPGNFASGSTAPVWLGSVLEGEEGDREAAKEVAWYEENSLGSTQEVGLKKPNALGLFDMSGNVHEWGWDWVSEEQRADHGGAFNRNAGRLQTGFVGGSPPDFLNIDVGFRIVATKQ